MKNLKFILLLLVGTSLATWSCTKDDPEPTPDPTPTAQTCYFSKVDYGDYYMIAEYNAAHQLTKVSDFDSTGQPEGTYTNLSYVNGKLSSFESYSSGVLDSRLLFHYAAGSNPDSVVIYSDDGSGNFSREAAYSLTFTGDVLTKAELVYKYMGFPIVISKTEFTYANSNVSKATEYNFDFTTLSLNISQTTDYEYDAKKNPFYNIGLNYLVFMEPMFGSTNNATKATVKDDSGATLQDASENITFEYSTNNYPTKSVSTTFDNAYTETTLFTYNCQ